VNNHATFQPSLRRFFGSFLIVSPLTRLLTFIKSLYSTSETSVGDALCAAPVADRQREESGRGGHSRGVVPAGMPERTLARGARVYHSAVTKSRAHIPWTGFEQVHQEAVKLAYEVWLTCEADTPGTACRSLPLLAPRTPYQEPMPS